MQELSLLEYEVLAFPPTAIAASCLVMALARYAQVAAAQQLQPTAPALAQAAASQQLQVCAHWLLLGCLPAIQAVRGCGQLPHAFMTVLLERLPCKPSRWRVNYPTSAITCVDVGQEAEHTLTPEPQNAACSLSAHAADARQSVGNPSSPLQPATPKP